MILFARLVGMIGKVLLGVAVYRVHSRVVKEHKIDAVVLQEMQAERRITLIGIVFIILEFIVEAPYFFSIDPFGLYR